MHILIKEAKLYPNKKQEERLVVLFDKCRSLYNKILETKINAYKIEGYTISRFDMQKIVRDWDRDLPSALKQMMVYRVNLAYERYSSRVANHPRFKAYNRFRSLDIRQYGNDYTIKDDCISVWRAFGVGRMKVRGLQKLEHPKNARIIRRASSWYLQVTDEVQQRQAEKTGNEVGIDIGLKYFVADSDGKATVAPKYFRKAQRKLRTAQRKLKNKREGSNRGRKQGKLISKIHEHTANQRRDFLHKVSRQYVTGNDTVYAEDLNVRGMAKNHHLSKSIYDASWNMFLRGRLEIHARNAAHPGSSLSGIEIITKGRLVADMKHNSYDRFVQFCEATPGHGSLV